MNVHTPPTRPTSATDRLASRRLGVVGGVAVRGGAGAFGGFLMILAALSMVFLDGSLAVFVAIAAAVSGMVLFVRGAQIEHVAEDPLAVEGYGIPEGFDSEAGHNGGADSGFD